VDREVNRAFRGTANLKCLTSRLRSRHHDRFVRDWLLNDCEIQATELETAAEPVLYQTILLSSRQKSDYMLDFPCNRTKPSAGAVNPTLDVPKARLPCKAKDGSVEPAYGLTVRELFNLGSKQC